MREHSLEGGPLIEGTPRAKGPTEKRASTATLRWPVPVLLRHEGAFSGEPSVLLAGPASEARGSIERPSARSPFQPRPFTRRRSWFIGLGVGSWTGGVFAEYGGPVDLGAAHPLAPGRDRRALEAMVGSGSSSGARVGASRSWAPPGPRGSKREVVGQVGSNPAFSAPPDAPSYLPSLPPRPASLGVPCLAPALPHYSVNSSCFLTSLESLRGLEAVEKVLEQCGLARESHTSSGNHAPPWAEFRSVFGRECSVFGRAMLFLGP